MSLARYFSKPRWQSRDEAIRRTAVAQDTDSALIESLPKLAREDSDAGVRLAAMRRLADPGLTQAMAADDRDEGVRLAARTLWSELLSGTHPAAPPLADRLRLLRAQDDPRLVEHIAVHAPESELRLAALQRIDRQALILERITGDADAAIRQAALERVDNEDHLARIVERTRKSDKIINRLASERLENLRVARGDRSAIEARARKLCERMERVLREGDGSDEAASIEEAWSAVSRLAPAVYVQRYKNARELFELSRNPEEVARLRQRAQDRARIEQELGELERQLKSPSALESIDSLAQRFDALNMLRASFADATDEVTAALSIRYSRLGAQLAGLQAQQSRQASASAEDARNAIEREQAQARREARKAEDRLAREQSRAQALADLQGAIEAATQAIQSGRSADAHASHAQLMQLVRRIDGVPTNLRDALADVESEYARIAQWQRWSDNQRRIQLCEELDALPSSGLHPDALATRLREIQAEWTHLDHLEGRPTQANDSLSRRYRALCRKAIEPAKPYFEKRDELRRQGSQETEALLLEAGDAALVEEPDWRKLAELRRRVGEALRNLDRVAPRERKTLATELKTALGKLDERVKARDQGVESAKNDLIARADALALVSETRTAITQARELQKLWQKCGNGRRARDQSQWKTFRKALDAVFARADDERNARSAREQEALASAAALCTRLEAIVEGEAEPDRAELKDIDIRWRELGVGDENLRRRYLSAQECLQTLLTRLRRKQQRAAYDVWLAHYDVLRRFENAQIEFDNMLAQRGGLPPLTLTSTEFEQRIERHRGAVAPADDAGRVRDCVLEMEQLAGIEPPAEDRQRRMDMQVEKLSARMRGEHAPAPEARLQSLLGDWLGLSPTGIDHDAREARFLDAMRTALESLG